MKIIVEFDSEEEFKARIKNPRGGRGGDKDEGEGQPTAAPAPLMPPQQGPGPNPYQQSLGPNPYSAPPPTTFMPPPQGGFPGAPVADPVVAGLVQRIVVRIDSAIASGQPADAVLNWFRGQCGGEAAGATMDQIKTIFLPKLAVPGLENIAKLMNA